MKVIVGLGNPGLRYSKTRHNAGYFFVEKFSETSKLKDVVIKKTDVFMNESGSFVIRMLSKYKIPLNNLYIVHDDLDIPLGEFKIQYGKGPKIHNGLNSIYEELGSHDFWHVRIGVDARTQENRPQGGDYVLENFTDAEKTILDKVIASTCQKLENQLK